MYTTLCITTLILYTVLLTGVDPVSFSEWEAIDEHERREGEATGKPREKIVDVNAMMDVVKSSRQS